MGEDGFLAYQCVIGGVNGGLFNYFLRNLIRKLRIFYEDTAFVIILDNASIHKTTNVA
jgi:hypothetical protein